MRSWLGGCLFALGLGPFFAAPSAAVAQTTGLTPLIDLGSGTYKGYEGGLYPGGVNTPPDAQRTLALAAAARIVPRNAAGAADPNGLIVMIAVGMSNTTHEFAVFERAEDANPGPNARVVLMDTALGGQTAAIIADPAQSYWTVMQQRLLAMGLSAAQVQVAWVKEADAQPPDDFPGHAQRLRDELELVMNNLHDKFPNLAIAYLSSRVYGGYAAPGSLNPEPQAYESGFSVRWLIADQIAGDPGLNDGRVAGPVRAPLLLWGPYLWADGTTPRSDGLTWLIGDFEGDHTHPGPSGEAKVAGLLSNFFAGEETAAAWWPAQPDATLVAIDALDDASVRAANPGMNFGSDPMLAAQGGASPINAYLGFDFTGSGRPVILAKLSARVAAGGGGNVTPVADVPWSESTITWATAPALGAPIVAMPQSSRDGTIAANVTAAMNADTDGLISFGLTTAATQQATYLSKEGGQPPRLVLVIPTACSASAGDTDGDLHSDGCDCAPNDPGAFAIPGEVANLRFTNVSSLAWESAAGGAGPATLYDVLNGDLAEIALTGTGPHDVCLASGTAALSLPDSSPAPTLGRGSFFYVRADNTCGAGRYRTATNGQDRLSNACP
ncbi:MAG TPA: DNRLRE domain-containing protein [Candidatus Polarisedimenticolia bacterium]|nr:DNRLRE domain-containing protein [Candidatus Polarisedimenticolia bacterium]